MPASADRSARWSFRLAAEFGQLMFPLDILAGNDSMSNIVEIIQKACQGTPEVFAWRDRIIGQQFWPDDFVEKLEKHL